MCLAQGPQRSDAGETRNRGPSVSSQALYHLATVLVKTGLIWGYIFAHAFPLKSREDGFVENKTPYDMVKGTYFYNARFGRFIGLI